MLPLWQLRYNTKSWNKSQGNFRIFTSNFLLPISCGSKVISGPKYRSVFTGFPSFLTNSPLFPSILRL